MGRPVNKHFFGATGIVCYARIGTAAAAKGYIVSQTSTHEFIVNCGGVVGTVNLVPVDKSALTANQMMIYVKMPDNSIDFVRSLKGHVLTTAGDKEVVWTTRTANPAPAAISMNGAEVAPTPVITIGTQPQAATVTHPATATFTVAATVTQGATLSYQWFAKGTSDSAFGAISGATSASYTTSATDVTMTGKKYHCVVSATGGAAPVTSSDAVLTVN